MGSTVDMRSGLRAMGALRPEQANAEEPVALEMTVLATGARPGGASAKRELFTEETQTVLIFERGAVIRLSAAVADGQLLFLTNKKTGKEVVTQVMRKRSFRPTSCYVDLEFTEPCPGFWGIEFSKAAASSPADPAMNGALAEDDAGSATVSATTPPDLQEVSRLKKEVAELQTQLQSLMGSAKGEESGAATGENSSPPNAEAAQEINREQHEEDLLKQLLTQEAEQERLHGPTRLVAYPKKSSLSSAAKKAGKVALAGAMLAVVASAGVAAYQFGMLDRWIGKRAASEMTQPASRNTVVSKAPAIAKNTAAPAPGISGAETTLMPGGKTSAVAEKPAATPVSAPVEVPHSVENSATPGPTVKSSTLPVGKEPKASHAAAGLSARAASPHAGRASGDANTSHELEAETGGSTPADDYVGPKLVHAVRPVSPPEALRNYVTGNVNVDALVDVTGHVKQVTVISGPEKLRKAAIDQMKEYLYQPARKSGKVVESHVQASLQFWYEP